MSRLKIVFSIIAIAFMSLNANAQCGDDLVASCAGSDGSVKYVKHFKIRFGKASSGTGQSKSTIMLTKGSHYRFYICNDVTKEGQIIASLSSPFGKFGSNVSPTSGNVLKAIDMMCTKTGPYFLDMKFKDGKEGCGVCVMSIVTN
jgi:hypothetical protein